MAETRKLAVILGHLYMGLIQLHTNRPAQGVAEYERALALDRNLAAAHGYIGQGEETETHVQEAFRLSPRAPICGSLSRASPNSI